METCSSAGLSISGSSQVFVSGRISTFGIGSEVRPPRLRDLRTMEGVDSTRLAVTMATCLKWVLTQ